MWTESTMGVGQSLIISGMGMLVVMGVLAILAIAIILLSKIVGAATKKKPAAAGAAPAAAAPAAAPAAVAAGLDEEAYAVLIAAVSEATRMPLSSFQITEIKEV